MKTDPLRVRSFKIPHWLIYYIIFTLNVNILFQIPDIPGKSYLKSHPVLGIIVTLLCVANVSTPEKLFRIEQYTKHTCTIL